MTNGNETIQGQNMRLARTLALQAFPEDAEP